MSIVWRFAQPWPAGQVCRVLCAGPHFDAGRVKLTNALRARGLLYGEKNQDHGKVEVVHAPTDEHVMSLAPTVHVAIPFMQRFSPAFIEEAKELRLIQQFGVGLEGVALECATQNGVAVSNIPASETGNAESTAEHALFLTLALLRQARLELPKRLEQGVLGGLPIPRSLFRKNVTVLGYGALGGKIVEYMSTMGANLTVVRRSPWRKADVENLPNIRCENDLKTVLPTTDVLIAACVLTPETRHMINHEVFSLLPSHAIVVNVARGPIVEYASLKNAIETGRVAGFASDVGLETKEGLPAEPWDTTDSLHNHPAVYFTPHVGGYTDHSYGAMADIVVQSILGILESRPPRIFVNNPMH